MLLLVLNLVGGFHSLGTLMAVAFVVLPAAASRFWVRGVGPQMARAPAGHSIARAIPATRPMMICSTRLGARKEEERSVITELWQAQTPILAHAQWPPHPRNVMGQDKVQPAGEPG